MTIHVMIADDHAVVRDGLKLLLETNPDIQVTGQASNGLEAVNVAKKTNPDVILMDIAMPDLNGIEAARMILEDNVDVKIVMLSMYSSSEHIYRALEAGAAGYLLKEAAGKEVCAAVRAVTNGQHYFSEKIGNMIIEGYLKQGKDKRRLSPLSALTNREREVLQLTAQGRSAAEISKQLYLSVKTVETYRSRLMRRLNIHDVPSLVKFAIQNGIISLD